MIMFQGIPYSLLVRPVLFRQLCSYVTATSLLGLVVSVETGTEYFVQDSGLGLKPAVP